MANIHNIPAKYVVSEKSQFSNKTYFSATRAALFLDDQNMPLAIQVLESKEKPTGKVFEYVTAVRHSSDGEIIGWDYKDEDGNYLTIISDF